MWTVVDGDPVTMRRGDPLLTPGWHFHRHHNVSDTPMTWLDGLDIPVVATLDQGFFEFGPDQVRDTSTPDRSRGERLWGGPGLTPVSAAGQPQPASPLMAYRWARTDAAHGDVVAVPSWCEVSLHADTGLDLFTFSDAPIFEKLSLLRTEVSR